MAIAAMRAIPIDVKANIIGMANLFRNSPPPLPIAWPIRAKEAMGAYRIFHIEANRDPNGSNTNIP